MPVPARLAPADFAPYPPEAKQRVLEQLPLLRRLPLSFAPLLLRELIVFDWKFPAERRDLDRQFEYLNSLSAASFRRAMEPFEKLHLSPELAGTAWVESPADFSERLTAHLWASHQIDAFRAAAVDYMREAGAAYPEPPLPMHRLGLVVLGDGNARTDYPLFQKLIPHGVMFTRVHADNGLETLLRGVAARAASHAEPYAHWCIDGGSDAVSAALSGGRLAHVSWSDLSPARAALQARMQKSYESAAFDPEGFRTMLARTRPGEIGLDPQLDPVLCRFQLSVLTEGSGTQVFSTTFVQWTAREALRRAQPLTLFARFAPRQREKPMNELLSERQRTPELDPEGSLIDADQGAYYTWMNQQRLPGAAEGAFLALFADRALAIGPMFEKSKRETSSVQLSDLLARIS